ncbi:hypothetical protein AWH56_012315 [Anaerobacillus isosaccharinicus]|uniref:Uncharacterized protein n=2 Tax=Anaerobacillus isosaccharinicus TaxID=1532552 RepID=A0A1S2LIY5_9BACI
MLKNGQIENFKNYSQFQSVAEFNEHFGSWMEKFGREFTRSEKIALVQLSRFAVKVVGVTNLKIGTALKVLHEKYNGNGISRSTWKRMSAKAKKIGLLVVHEMKRDSGGQSSNLYVFMRFEGGGGNLDDSGGDRHLSNRNLSNQPEPPCAEKLNHHKTNNLETIKKDIEKNCNAVSELAAEPLDHTYTSDHVPRPFVNLVKVFFNNCDTIEEYWKMAKLAAYKYVLEKDHTLVLDVAIQAFKQMIRKLKKVRLKKPIAYYYTIALNKFADQFYQELDEIGEKDVYGM